MEVNIEQLAQNYSELADEELLRMHASGQLTEVAYKLLEKELAQRAIPIPQRMDEVDGAPERPLTIRALWTGRAPLGSAWGLLIALNIVANVVNIFIEAQGSPVVDIVLAIVALPFAIFALVALWRCAWNTGWQGWGLISRAFVVLFVMLIAYGWIAAFL